MRIIDTLRVLMMRINIHGDALSLIVSNKTDSCAFFGVDLACCFSSYPTRVILMSKSKSILDFVKVNLESEKVTHDSPEDHDHSEPSVSGLVPPVTGGVSSESLQVVDDTDLLDGLDINQHASDKCTTPSELPKTLECLPMEEDLLRMFYKMLSDSQEY